MLSHLSFLFFCARIEPLLSQNMLFISYRFNDLKNKVLLTFVTNLVARSRCDVAKKIREVLTSQELAKLVKLGMDFVLSGLSREFTPFVPSFQCCR